MTIKYAPGQERKKLAAAVAQHLVTGYRYAAAPTMAYIADEYTITREWVLTGPDSWELVTALRLEGFEPVEETYDEEPAEQAAEAEGSDHPDRLVVEVPLEGFDDASLDRLHKLITSKAPLLKMALPIEVLAGELRAFHVEKPMNHITQEDFTMTPTSELGRHFVKLVQPDDSLHRIATYCREFDLLYGDSRIALLMAEPDYRTVQYPIEYYIFYGDDPDVRKRVWPDGNGGWTMDDPDDGGGDPPVTPPNVGDILDTDKTGDTSKWIVIDKKNVSGTDYLLILRGDNIGASTSTGDYIGDGRKTAVTDWYNGTTNSNLVPGTYTQRNVITASSFVCIPVKYNTTAATGKVPCTVKVVYKGTELMSGTVYVERTAS